MRGRSRALPEPAPAAPERPSSFPSGRRRALENVMGKIRYATCTHCGAFSALDEKDAEGDRVLCFHCNLEFAFDKEILRTLDEIVEERDVPRAPKKA